MVHVLWSPSSLVEMIENEKSGPGVKVSMGTSCMVTLNKYF